MESSMAVWADVMEASQVKLQLRIQSWRKTSDPSHNKEHLWTILALNKTLIGFYLFPYIYYKNLNSSYDFRFEEIFTMG